MVLLDGHHRYALCQQHGLDCRLSLIVLDSREAAINWLIDNQFGRRNLTPEQKSYLRGKRYNLEKTSGHGKSAPENQGQTTAERLAQAYQVSRDTIEKDGSFAEAVDTLEAQVKQDIRQAVLQRKSRADKARTTKQQVTQAGKAIQARRVKPLPFMRRADWKDYQVIEAITLLESLTLAEQTAINTLLDRPHIPASAGLQIVRNLVAASAEHRQRIATLQASRDPREPSLALTLAGGSARGSSTLPPPGASLSSPSCSGGGLELQLLQGRLIGRAGDG